MFRKAIPLLLPFFLIFTNCQDETDEGEKPFICPAETVTPCGVDSNRVNLRIDNVSQFDYCNVHVHSSNGQETNYGEILSGDTSCYVTFDTLYDHPWIYFLIQEDTITINAGEYIPNLPFNGGFFICSLGVKAGVDTSKMYVDFEILAE